ncbi:putative acetyltransferase [Tolypocladium ophioglossoides CBS 100239]|uniref:Putative acetyltransferase n=1 Tax=Tolypocladium ophioglossoides (strain CBS 100239) TaxID=1163406 RepID=A0A0L0NCN0_TOLOC|nr:putative acetyltransferase [Tolypocladium ophioglossoides CBS 100239]
MAASSKNLDLIAEVKQSDVPVPWCDEFEKMISGMKFANVVSLRSSSFATGKSQELCEAKVETLKKLQSFNDDSVPDGSTLASLKARRMAVAKAMLGKLGENSSIEQPFFVSWGCNVFVGEGVYLNRDVQICDNAPVFIGDRVLVGPSVCITTATHPIDMHSRQQVSGTSCARPIRIESDCWIGANVTILAGVRIGRGTTIAAGAVVAADIEPECLVGGVPARLIRRLSVPK